MNYATISVAYFPGCAMKDQARAYEQSSLAALAALGVEVTELPRWNCCGTVYSLSEDDLMRHVGPVRNLLRAREMGKGRLLTLCAMCYCALSRSARFVGQGDRLDRINAFMDDEPDYDGGVQVLHLLQLLREEIGLERLSNAVVRSLDGLAVASYYGCTLLRPREIGVDDPDQPRVMEDVVAALGGKPTVFPEQTECCGAYLTAVGPEVVDDRVGRILASARSGGADVIVTSCPLCHYNLEAHRPPSAGAVRLVYLGELLAHCLVADWQAADPLTVPPGPR